MPVRYRRLVLRVGTADRELLSALLWECGTLGIEERAAGSLVAYFEESAGCPEVDWSRYGARLLACDELEERDWLAAYRARARPLAVGTRLIVDPREPEAVGEPARGPAAAGPGRHLLRLPARTAFGTGSHASTRLVVELLERVDLEGLSVLDVGAGSGILSFAARLFGAARVVGIEIDLGAALVGAQNRGLNGIFPSFVAGGIGALAAGARFDLALVNVLPELIAADLGAIRGRLRAGGSAIFSGILTDAVPAVRARLAGAGFEPRGEHSSAGWTALEAGVAGE